jgi:predicted HTH domain antitoxin
MQQIQIALPDELASSLQEKWGNLERKLMEIIAIEAYREGSISSGKLRELLGFSTPLEADKFLKAKGVYLDYDEEDFIADRQTHEQLEQEGKLKRLRSLSAIPG